LDAISFDLRWYRKCQDRWLIDAAASTYHRLIAFIQAGLYLFSSPLLLRAALLVTSIICISF
jgi:hypothetical protein